MNISCILNGTSANVVDVSVEGSDIYISYVTSGGQLQTTKGIVDKHADYTVIATSATIIS